MKETAVLIVIACVFIALTVGQIAITNASTVSVNVRDNESTASVAASSETSSQRVELININTASEDLLCEIDGIGPSLAQRIIEYRDTNGNFTCVEDLMKVKGIGEATFEKMKPFITV